MNGVAPILYAQNGKVYIDVALTDGSGHLPVEIRKNVFVIRPPNWDRNSSATALEVVNENLVPVFQLIFRSPSQIQINGIFPTPKGDLLVVEESRVRLNPPLPTLFSIKRIFKYPSWKYPGQYEP